MSLISKELISKGAETTFKFIKKNIPHILTGTAVVGVATTAVFSVKGCLSAKKILEDEELRRIEKDPSYDQKFTKKEKIKLAWKPFIPAIGSGIVTVVCIIAADVISSGRNAALLSLLTASEKALESYQKNNIELFGEKNHEKILDEKAKNEVENTEIPEEDLILKTYTGDMLILDEWNGRYFKGSRDAIDKAINAMNYDMYEHGSAFNNGFVSVNDFYDNIGISEKTQYGFDYGWDRRHPITVDYRSALKDDSIPVLVLSFKNTPLPTYALDDKRNI